jgi:hypothetical protein
MENQSKLGLANYILQLNSRYGRIKRGGQEHAPENHEKGARDKNREAQKSSEVGHTNDRKEGSAAEAYQMYGVTPSARLPLSLADWLATRTKEIGLPDR